MIYYINGETGLDTNDGLTSENAFKTINKAYSMLSGIEDHYIYIEGKASDDSQIVYDEQIIGGIAETHGKGFFNVDGKNILLSGIFVYYIGVNNPKIEPTSGFGDTKYPLEVLGGSGGFNSFILKNITLSNLGNNADAVINADRTSIWGLENCILQYKTYGVRGYSNGYYFFKNCHFQPQVAGLYIDYGLYKNAPIYFINNEISHYSWIRSYNNTVFTILNSFSNKLIISHSANSHIEEFFCDYGFELYQNPNSLFIKSIFKSAFTYLGGSNNNNYFKNCVITDDIEIVLIDGWTLENCIIDSPQCKLKDGNIINPKFINCIFTGNKPVDIPEDNFINCVFNTDPLLDSEFKPQYNSPCLPQNWTGENPIDTFIGRYDFYEEPSISNLIVSGDKDKIDISFTAVGSDIANTILKFSFDNETWFDMTLLDENKFVKSSYLGNVNTFTWKSKQDFLSDEIVFIEVQIHDDKNYSNILSTSTMVYNEPILLIEPDIMDIMTNGTKGDIEISLNVFDEYSIVSGMLQYYDNSIWNNCTLKYGNGYFSASEIGEENTVLWDSYLDFQDDLTTKVRCSVTDKDGLSSGWVESPIFTIKNLYIEPIISSINTIGTAQDIKITYIVEDDDTEIIESEFQYLNGSDWFSCTIDYNIGLASKSSPEGVFNTVLWKSEIDIQEDITTKIRIRVFDSEWSSWYESGDILIQNGNIPPDILYYSPLKFKLEDDKKLYFKLKKE